MIDLDALGVWLPVRVASPESISFDPNAASTGDETLWQIDLSASPSIANQDMDARIAQLNRFDQGLAIAAKRFQRFNDSTARRPGGASFEIGETIEALPPPESELLSWVNQIGGASVNYSIGESIGARLNQASPEFQALIERLMNMIAHYARVETNAGGEALGQTVVSWTGDRATAWRATMTPAQVGLHYRALALALASRHAYLRLFALATRGAAMLAALPALLTTPGGALVALPAAYKFIHQVLAELDQTRNLYGGLQNG
jgi:hypothetical protein